jgi:uncharacterized protein (DUF885 family)
MAPAPAALDQQLVNLIQVFVQDYKLMALPPFTPDYLTNFKSIQDQSSLKQNIQTFKRYRDRLREFNRKTLSGESKYLFEQLRYEIEVNLVRLELELDFRASLPARPIPKEGFWHLPNHRRWYGLYLRLAASQNLSPVEAMRLGEKEVSRISKEVSRIQKSLGFAGRDQAFYQHLKSDTFILQDEKTILSTFEGLRDQPSSTTSRL